MGYSAYLTAVQADTPLIAWFQQITSGTTEADDSGNSLTGALAGGYTLSQTGPGTTNLAIAYNGSTGNCQRSTSALGNLTSSSQFSIEAWCKGTTGASNASIFGCSRSGSTAPIIALMLGGTGNVFPVFRIRCDSSAGPDAFSSTPSGTSVCDGNWHHLVGVYNGTSALTYVDSVLLSTVNGGAMSAATLDRTTAGALQRTTLSFPYTGSVAFCAAYGTALSLARVQAHYNAMTASSSTIRRRLIAA